MATVTSGLGLTEDQTESSETDKSGSQEFALKLKRSQVYSEVSKNTTGYHLTVNNAHPSGSGSRALQNELVLETIAKFVSATGLLALRGTSGKWNHAFVSGMKSKHTPVQLKSHNIQELQGILASSKEVPFSGYRIDYFDHTNFSSYLNFFSAFGNSVQRLSINASLNDKQGDRQAVLNAIREIVFNLTPELVDLDLKFDLVIEARSKLLFKRSRTGLQDALGREPKPLTKRILKLRRFVFNSEHTISQSLPEVEQLFGDLLKSSVGLAELKFDPALCDVSQMFTISNLGGLKSLIVDNLSFRELKMLTELGEGQLKLRHLEIHLEYCGSGLASLLFAFLETQATQILEFKFHNRASAAHTPVNVLNIPVMDKLRTLSISGPGSSLNVRYEAETFSSNFRSLKELVLDDQCVDEPGTCRPDTKQRSWWETIAHPGVTHLVSKQTISAPWLHRFGVMLPSVSRFVFPMNRYIMGTMANTFWSTWPSLQTLHIHYYSPHKKHYPGELDEFVSGVRRVCDLRRELEESSPIHLDTIRILLSKHKTERGISDLEHLQKFVLDIHCTAGMELTDIGGLFGIAMANPSLQHFEVNRIAHIWGHDPHPLALISAKARALIREALGTFAYINIC